MNIVLNIKVNGLKEFVKHITKIRFAIFTSEITVRQFKQEFYFPLWLPDEFRERR